MEEGMTEKHREYKRNDIKQSSPPFSILGDGLKPFLEGTICASLSQHRLHCDLVFILFEA
jgi:hypothetical protein